MTTTATIQQIDLTRYIADLRDTIFPANRLIFLGKGPSAIHAKDHCDGHDVITANDAGKLIPGVFINFVIVDGGYFAMECADHVDRIGCMVSPYYLDDSGMDGLTWARYPVLSGRKDEAALRQFCENREVAYLTPAESGMLLAAAIGYKEIWCFGHDGGQGRCEGVAVTVKDFNYDIRRQRVELAARHLEELYGTVTRFWPEGF